MPNIEFRKYSNDDFGEVVNLLTLLWDSKDLSLNKEFFKWKYNNNPFTQTVLAFVATDDNKIISFRGYVAAEFRLKDNKYPIALLSDTISLPEYRGKGIFRKLTDFSLKYLCNLNYFKAILNLSPSWTPTRGYFEFGWVGLAEQVAFYSIKIPNFISIEPTFTGDKTIRYRDFIVVISKNKLEAELIDFYKKNKHYTQLESNKTERYIDFKYGNPALDYVFIYLFKENRIVNFISSYFYSHRKLKLLEIGKFNYTELKNMLNAIHKTFRPHLISYFSIVTLEEHFNVSNKVFTFNSKNLIFKKLFGKNKPPRLIRATDYELKENSWFLNSIIDIRLRKNWILNPIDSDSL